MADRWGYGGYAFPNLTNTSTAWSGLSSPSRTEPSSGATASNQNQPPVNYDRGLSPYACTECGYSFQSSTTEDITRHMLTHIGPAQPAAPSSMGPSTVHSMYGGMPSTVTSPTSNGVTPMSSYHHYSQSNAFPSAYAQSAFPGQQRSSHSAFPGHDRMSQYAFPGNDRSSHSAFPHQERPSQSAFPGQERLSQSAFPGQERSSQSAYPGHEHPSPSVYPGHSPPQNAFPGQNRSSQSLFPGQSPPQNAFPGQPPSMNVFPGQMPPHYSQPKPPPLIPAPHLQKQLANQQNQLDNKSIIESIYSYPLSKPKDSIPDSILQDSNSISKPKESETTKPKESETTKPKESGSISKPKESDQKIESTPQEMKKSEKEIDFAKPIFVHSKVLEKRKNSVAEVIESVIKSHTRDDSDEDSSSIKTENDESFTVSPKKFKPDPEIDNIITSEIPTSTTTEKDNGSKKISITPFAHMDSRAMQKQKSDVLNFFPSKHKYKKTAPPKKRKPKELNSTPKPAPKPLQPRGTNTRGLRAKAEVNYAVLDDPYDHKIKDPDKPKRQPYTTIQGFKEFPGKVRKSPVKKRESSESDKVKTEPGDENSESSDDNGEEKSSKDEATNQLSNHPLFSILGGEEEYNEHEGETEEPEQSDHIDLSSFLDTGVSSADIVNPNAPRNKAAPVFTSNPTEWGYPEKPDKDYSGKRYQCDYCDYGSSELTNIKTHIRGHTGEKPYKCTVCNFASSRSNSIKMHMRTHTGEKPFKCDLCGKAFTKSSNLIVHRKTHTGEKDYKCAMCGDAFITPGELKKHIRSHTGEKPYKCKHCEQRFSDSSTLQRHTKTHTGEKPYECDICGKNFTRGDTLTHHRRTHTGEKPYKCSMCPKAYIQSCRLKQHMMKDHFAHLAKQAMDDTEEQMGEEMFNEMDEPDDPEDPDEMYGAEGYLEEQAMEETQNIIEKAMQVPGSAENDRSESQVKTENDTDNMGNKDLQTESEVKTEDNTDDVGNQINEEEEKPESAKTLYKIKTWKSVKIKKPKHYQF